jgi:hypothetical protein
MKTPKVKKIKASVTDRLEAANKTSRDLFHHEDTQKASTELADRNLHAFLTRFCCVAATGLP